MKKRLENGKILSFRAERSEVEESTGDYRWFML